MKSRTHGGGPSRGLEVQEFAVLDSIKDTKRKTTLERQAEGPISKKELHTFEKSSWEYLRMGHYSATSKWTKSGCWTKHML